jgi:hypothetical protein
MGRLHSYVKTYTRALAGVQENGMADDRNWLVDHKGIGVSEIFGSAKFYEATVRPLGIEALVRIARNFKRIDKDGPDLGGVGFGIDYPVFWIDVFHPHGVKQHTRLPGGKPAAGERFPCGGDPSRRH